MVVKSEFETKWNARTEAVKLVNKYLEEIFQIFQDNENETSETRSDAMQLYNRILNYDFLILLGFWNKVLIHIDRVQKRQQDSSMNKHFQDATLNLKALRDHFDEREVLVSESLDEKELGFCQEWNVKVERCQKRKKQIVSENSRDDGLTIKEEMERVMKRTFDRLHREMDERFTHLHDIDAKFRRQI